MRGKGRPFLGICVGMQLMATRGLEFEVTDGLDWIAGEVRAIEPGDPTLKIPHMGWNTLKVVTPHPLLDGIKTGPQGLHAYFVHSFQLVPEARAAIVAETDYGGPVTAMVAKDNMAGTQFHPEKSQTLGLHAHRQLPEVAALASPYQLTPRNGSGAGPGRSDPACALPGVYGGVVSRPRRAEAPAARRGRRAARRGRR